MKANNRVRILEGVIAIIERDGLTAVTFDAVAAETGITRGGLIYHFRSRDELITASHAFLADRWRVQLDDLAEKRAGGDRQQAYILSGGETPSRAEMVLMLDSAHNDRVASIWSEVRDSAAPSVPAEGDAAAMARFIAGLASDGLWLMQAQDPNGLPPAARERVMAALIEMSCPKPDQGV